MSNRMSKGSDDALELHNIFGSFEESDDIEIEETPHITLLPGHQSCLHSVQSNLSSKQKSLVLYLLGMFPIMGNKHIIQWIFTLHVLDNGY